MGLSSNILWHQTDYRGALKILRSKVVLNSYSLEKPAGFSGEIAFPMVSMCDLPFSELSNYLDKYGGYCIGFSRTWGIKKNFNPVWYCEPSSAISSLLAKKLMDAVKNDDENSLQVLFNVFAYWKMVEGPLNKHHYTKYRFYDEREFRHVPSFEFVSGKGDKPILTAAQYDQYKKDHKNSLLKYGVSFEWGDIKYIIVKESSQIEKFRTYLDNVGNTNHAISIFSISQINEDFLGFNHNEVEPEPNEYPIEELWEMLKEIE